MRHALLLVFLLLALPHPSLAADLEPVKIVEGGRSLSGRGMEYNNDTRELLLRHDVVARFTQEPGE